MFAIAILTILSLSILLAMIAASLWIADKLEQRREEPDSEHLTPLQRAMLEVLSEQPR